MLFNIFISVAKLDDPVCDSSSSKTTFLRYLRQGCSGKTVYKVIKYYDYLMIVVCSTF